MLSNDLDLICTEEAPNHSSESSSRGSLILPTEDKNYFLGNINGEDTKADVTLFEFEEECGQNIQIENSEDCEIQLKIFPNPAPKNVNLTIDNVQKIKEIVVVNSLGQEIFQQKGQDLDNNILLNNLGCGTYYFRINSECGIKTEKVVIVK